MTYDERYLYLKRQIRFYESGSRSAVTVRGVRHENGEQRTAMFLSQLDRLERYYYEHGLPLPT